MELQKKVMHVRVAGVTFEGRQAKIARLHGTEAVRIEAEPENPYDANALAVKVAMPPPPESSGEILHIGYIPRDLAAIIAPKLEGESMMVKIHEITGGGISWSGKMLSYGVLLELEVDF